MVERNNHNSLDLSIYRKPTFTGLGIHFLSACYQKYKTNTISTLVHRAFSISSNFTNFHLEIEFLKNFFGKNGFNNETFYNYVRRFLNRKYNPKERKMGPMKQTMYFRFPFISDNINQALNKDIKAVFETFLPQIVPKIAIHNHFKIKSFFQIKEF